MIIEMLLISKKDVKLLIDAISELTMALKVSKMMLDGTCQHGYDTSRSARGCDECAKQIEAAIARVENHNE